MGEIDPGFTLTGILEHWATTTPDAVAVECRGDVLTYRELGASAQRVADHIHARGVRPGSLVALCVSRSLESAVSIMGVLKSGCAYVPIDVDNPVARNLEVLSRTSPALVISDGSASVDELGIPTLLLSECAQPVARVELSEVSPPALAYIMPTSGTGGALKLVRIAHGNVAYNVQMLGRALGGVTSRDTYLHFASFSFSSSVRQLFLPLSVGARIVIAVGSERLDPDETLELIDRSGITVVDIIPSFLSVMVDALEARAEREVAGAKLRLLLLASERLPGHLVERWTRSWSGPLVRIHNMYGQTETAGIVSVHQVDDTTRQSGTVPIGRPIDGSVLRVVDDSLASVPAGAVGEILVSGGGLSSGYHGDEMLTASRFLSADARDGGTADRSYRTGDLGRVAGSGEIEFVGRRDSQVKVRGHKVDLSEVELVLESHPAVAEAVVANISDDGDEVRVHAYARLSAGFVDARVEERLRELPNGLKVVDLNPPETDFMYEEIFVREVYFRGGITVPEGACIIDAGANIGLFSLAVATTYPDARVFAFEPAVPTAAVLKTNMLINSCEQVSVRVQGLSNRRGAATLTFYPHSVGMSSVHASRDEERATLTSIISNQLRRGELADEPELGEYATELVDAKLVEQQLECTLIRISDILDAEGISQVDLLKVDVQKSEIDVLEGIRDEHWERIKQIVLEVHDLGGRVQELVSGLEGRGYSTVVEQDELFIGSDVYYVYARRGSTSPAKPRSVHRRSASLAPVSEFDLRGFLGARLADFQLPESIAIVPDFPRTVSGKIDRNAVIRTESWNVSDGPELVAKNADPIEDEIIGIFSEVLKKKVAPRDDFFEIGGNSISAARVITRIRERYGTKIKITLIFAESRLDLFAAKVREILTAKPEN